MSLGKNLFNARKQERPLPGGDRGKTRGQPPDHLQMGSRKFHIVKDTKSQTHAYITSRTLNFGGTSHETTDFL